MHDFPNLEAFIQTLYLTSESSRNLKDSKIIHRLSTIAIYGRIMHAKLKDKTSTLTLL